MTLSPFASATSEEEFFEQLDKIGTNKTARLAIASLARVL
jgi:hypothetical protein